MRLFQLDPLRRLAPRLCACALALAATAPAGAQTEPVPEVPAQVEPEKPSAPKIETLDSLFVDLKAEADPTAAKRISERIWARWRDSGSATGNLLMQWANTALAEKKNSLALDLLDQLIVLMPDYAESWNQRATLHYIMGNYDKSMSDINRVLALEPRHFGALAGMAAIFTAGGNDQLALRAWEQMLAIYPSNREAQTKLGDLADKLSGSRT